MPIFRSCGNSEDLRATINAMQADVAELRTQFVALLAKMDADFADVTNASTDYAASVTPAAITASNLTRD